MNKDTPTDMQTDTQTYRQKCIQTDMQTHTHADSYIIIDHHKYRQYRLYTHLPPPRVGLLLPVLATLDWAVVVVLVVVLVVSEPILAGVKSRF